ncbi:HAD family phosphatase [Candidatus Micrarchaeota archaeon]|nr:HAD family phosphatase [Candidatus Micrarchaeota archaeon]
MIKAVLFDFDGVVVQSERLHMDSFMELLAPFGVKVSEERWYREFAGTGSRSIIKRLAKEYGIREDIGRLVEKRKKLYEDRVRNGELRETRGVKPFLNALRKRGIKAAIVSGSHSSNVSLAISTLGLDGLFDLVVSGDDVDARKPDPGPFLHAAEKLGVKPSECLVIEDSYAGCEAARRARMRLVVVRSPASKGLYGYDAIIDDFSEFPLEMIST